MIGRLFTISQSVKNGSISQRCGQTSDWHGLAPYGRKSNSQGKLVSSSGRKPTSSAERNALQSGPDDSPPGWARPDKDFYETPEGAANQPPAASRYQNRQVNHCGWPACLPFLRSMAYGICDKLCSPSLNTPQRGAILSSLERIGRNWKVPQPLEPSFQGADSSASLQSTRGPLAFPFRFPRKSALHGRETRVARA